MRHTNRLPVTGIMLGDHAGIGPEITAMALMKVKGILPVLIGNRSLFERAMRLVPGSEAIVLVDLTAEPSAPKLEGKVYFYNVDAGPDIRYGKVSQDSGKLILDSILSSIELEKRGVIDGFVMGPITKQALHAAGLRYSSEFEIYAEQYGVSGVRAVVKGGDIFRCTVVGHVRFAEIANKLTTRGVIDTAHALLGVMSRFLPPQEIRIAVAALNPHAGEDGLFGDEEKTVLQPAIDQLRSEGYSVIGPSPADTVYYRAQTGRIHGIVYLYHDQGNIAMKAASFGEGVLIYVNVPANIVSVGHGGAFGSAGKGTANPQNIIASIETLAAIVRNQKGLPDEPGPNG